MTGSIDAFHAGVLGVVEGITEFLPVSSTAHLTVAESLLGLKIDDPAVTAFTAIIQFGAILATFVYFRRDIGRLAGAWFGGLTAAGRRGDPEFRMANLIILGSLPVGLVGFLGKDLISGPLRNLWVVAAALIAWTGVMYLAEWRPRQKFGEHDLSWRQVLLIGGAQCLALIPGVSRSGATISAALLLGVSRVAATRLSFLLAIPALTAAGVYELKDVDTSVVSWGVLGLGTAISFVTAYLSIAWLLRLVAHHRITVFGPYRVLAGLAVVGLLLTGALTPTG